MLPVKSVSGPEAAARYGRWLRSTQFAVALIVAATLASYANSLRTPFVFDDLVGIVENRSIRRLWPPGEVFVVRTPGGSGLNPRPVVVLSLAVNHAMGGLETLPYHATNLAIHLLAGLTLFGIVRRTLVLPGLAERFGRSATALALAAALLWALHPIQVQAVTYVTQRYESLMGLFYLLAVYSFIRAATSARRRAWAAASVAAALAAMGSKEVAVSVPLIILLYDRAFLAGSFREALRRRRGLYAGLAGAWALLALLLVSAASRGKWAGYGMPLLPWLDYARTEFGVVLHYLRVSFWPQPLVLDYGWPVARRLGEILPGVVVVGGLAAVSILALVRRPKWGFLGAWFFLILAPTSSVMPISDPAFIHRMYLPLAAVVVAVVLGAQIAGESAVRRRWVPQRAAVAAGACLAAAVAASLAWMTWRRNEDFRSPFSIWADTVAKAPNNPRAHNNLGNLLAAQGRIDEAAAEYRRALQIFPEYTGVHYNLAIILAQRGQADEAIAHYRRALEIDPDYVDAHNNLGSLLDRLGQIEEATAHFQKALALDPGHAGSHTNFANFLARRGQTDEAIAHYRRALELMPENLPARHNLGVLLANRGQTAEAIVHLRAALSLAVRQGDRALAEELGRKLARYEGKAPGP